jgi:flagellar hook-basal body complex protein FliE
VIVPPVGGVSGGLSLGAVEGLAPSGQSSAGVGAGGEAGGFGGELTEAISSLEKTQDSASSASQALATGTVSDPESAVVTVEDAQMAMELAAQIRTKATEAAQNIFNTQV